MQSYTRVLLLMFVFSVLFGCSRSDVENSPPLADDPALSITESAPIEEIVLPELSTLSVQPVVAAPGDEIVFRSNLQSGKLSFYTEGFDSIDLNAGTARFILPEGTADGIYYVALVSDQVPVAYASFRLASEPGIWLSANRSFADTREDTILYLHSYNLPEGLLAGIFVTESPGEDPVPYAPDENGRLSPGSFVPIEQIINRPLLLPAGVNGRLVAQVEPDYYAETLPEETIWQSEVIDLNLCTEPGSLSGNLDEPGVVNVVWIDGSVRSQAKYFEQGDFRFSIQSGYALLQRVTGLDADQATIDSQLVFVECGQDLRVEVSGEINTNPTMAELYQSSSEHQLVSLTDPKPSFKAGQQAGGNDPCRRAFVFPFVMTDGELDIDLSEAAGLALKTAVTGLVPRIEVTTYSDLSALTEALAEAQMDEDAEAEIPAWEAVAQSVATDFLVGLTSAKLGNSYPVALSGQAQLPGDASVRSSGSGSSSSIQSPSFSAYQSFAEALSHAAICGIVEPESKKVALGEEVEIDYFVTDLTGEPLDGAEVSISNPACGELDPREGSTETGLFETTYTYPDDETCVENLDFSSEWNGPSGAIKTLPKEAIAHLYPEPITMQIYVGHDPSVGATSNIVGTVIPTFPPRPNKTAPNSLPVFRSGGTCGEVEGGIEIISKSWSVRDEAEMQRAEASVLITPIIDVGVSDTRSSSEEAGNDHFLFKFINKAVSFPPNDGQARSSSGYSGNYVDWLSGEGFPGTIFLIDIKNPDKLPNFRPVIRWDALIDYWGESGNSYGIIVVYQLVNCSNPLNGNGLGNILNTGQPLILLDNADGGPRNGEFFFPEIKDERYQIALYVLNVASAGSVRDDEIGMYSSGMTRLELFLELYMQQEVPEQ